MAKENEEKEMIKKGQSVNWEAWVLQYQGSLRKEQVSRRRQRVIPNTCAAGRPWREKARIGPWEMPETDGSGWK